MTTEPLSEDLQVLCKHHWAVRVNLPTNVTHVATLALRLLDSAAYARLAVPSEVRHAAMTLQGFAVAVERLVEADRAEQHRSGLDEAHFMRQLEEAYYRAQAPAAADRG